LFWYQTEQTHEHIGVLSVFKNGAYFDAKHPDHKFRRILLLEKGNYSTPWILFSGKAREAQNP